MTRKRSVPDVEPLFDEDQPKRRRRKKREEEEETDEPASCAATNCKLPAAPPSRYCNMHTLMFDGVRKLRDSGRRAAARGDFGKGVLHGLASTGLDLLGQLFSNVGGQVVDGIANQAASGVNWDTLFAQQAGAPPPRPAVKTCWEILGLDPATATADDIRTVQRKLAAIYHADKKNPAIAQGKLAEINAAASEALASR